MPERATNSARFRIGCALTLVALSLGACSTYDDALLVGYNAASAAEAGANNAGDAGGDAGHAGASPGAPSALGGTGADAGSAGVSSGDADTGVGAETGMDAGADAAGLSGTGGSSSTGGTIGSGGAAVAGAAAAGGAAPNAPVYELIDDFEDLDGFLLSSHKRNGPWYVFNDMTKTGTQSPFTVALLSGANVRPGSSAALHMTAKGFTDWGAGVGADFVNQAAKKVPYDVSAYSGIHFYAKIASGTQASLKLLIPTIYSDADGGKCSDTVTAEHCSDHLFYAVNGLKTSWDEYVCNFDELVQQGFGLVQPTLDPSGVYSIQFTLTTKALPADIWIDDVSFVKK